VDQEMESAAERQKVKRSIAEGFWFSGDSYRWL
jgi:hypothetical protein